jgi:hypothetical protein
LGGLPSSRLVCLGWVSWLFKKVPYMIMIGNIGR